MISSLIQGSPTEASSKNRLNYGLAYQCRLRWASLDALFDRTTIQFSMSYLHGPSAIGLASGMSLPRADLISWLAGSLP